MKQSEYKNIKECQKDIIYPIYKDQDICKGLIETLGYDLNNSIDKEFNKITQIHTLGKLPFETITFIGLGFSQDITTTKLRKAFGHVSQGIKKESVFIAKKAVTNNISIEKITELLVESHIIAQ